VQRAMTASSPPWMYVSSWHAVTRAAAADSWACIVRALALIGSAGSARRCHTSFPPRPASILTAQYRTPSKAPPRKPHPCHPEIRVNKAVSVVSICAHMLTSLSASRILCVGTPLYYPEKSCGRPTLHYDVFSCLRRHTGQIKEVRLLAAFI